MKSILIPVALTLLVFGGLCYNTYEYNHTPRVGQVWIRDIETSYGLPNHVDTIVILGIDDEFDTVEFTKLQKYDRWNCSMYTVKHYGTFLK